MSVGAATGITGLYRVEAPMSAFSAMSPKNTARTIPAAPSIKPTTVRPLTCTFISGFMDLGYRKVWIHSKSKKEIIKNEAERNSK